MKKKNPNENGFDCLKKATKRLAGAKLSCVTAEVCMSGKDAWLYEIRGVSVFHFFSLKTSLVQSGFF